MYMVDLYNLKIYNLTDRGRVQGNAPAFEVDFSFGQYILEGPLQPWYVDPCRSRQIRRRSRCQNARPSLAPLAICYDFFSPMMYVDLSDPNHAEGGVSESGCHGSQP